MWRSTSILAFGHNKQCSVQGTLCIQLMCVFSLLLQEKMDALFKNGEGADAWIPVDVSFIKEFWLPDAEILNLKEFKTLDVLSKLEGLWLNRNFEIMYAVATRITFICPMTFNSFPLDVQVCRFQVGSFNYDTSKMIFLDEFIADENQIRSVLDYFIEIRKLPPNFSYYVALTGEPFSLNAQWNVPLCTVDLRKGLQKCHVHLGYVNGP